MKIQSVDLDGQLVRVGIRRANSALPPLLIFNGIGANLELLEPFVEALGDVEVTIFDVPGAGGSPTPRKPYRFPTLCVLTDRLLTEIGYDGPLNVLGVSWGGALAQQFARRYPKRCRRLVLAATTPGVTMFPARLSVLLKMLGPRRYRDPAFLQQVGAEIYGGTYTRDPSCSRNTTTTYEPPKRVATSINFLHCGDGQLAVAATPATAHARHTWDDDPIVPLINARIIAACVRCAALHVIDDGHLFLVSQTDRVAALVRDFLQRMHSVNSDPTAHDQ